jgi:hypothetical protein
VHEVSSLARASNSTQRPARHAAPKYGVVCVSGSGGAHAPHATVPHATLCRYASDAAARMETSMVSSARSQAPQQPGEVTLHSDGVEQLVTSVAADAPHAA